MGAGGLPSKGTLGWTNSIYLSILQAWVHQVTAPPRNGDPLRLTVAWSFQLGPQDRMNQAKAMRDLVRQYVRERGHRPPSLSSGTHLSTQPDDHRSQHDTRIRPMANQSSSRTQMRSQAYALRGGVSPSPNPALSNTAHARAYKRHRCPRCVSALRQPMRGRGGRCYHDASPETLRRRRSLNDILCGRV